MSEFAGLFRPESMTPVYTEERCYITELLNSEKCEDVSLARCRVQPGVTTQLHALEIAERYVIQQGHGVMELAGTNVFAILPGDSVLIPAGCHQRVRNDGQKDLIFLCVCTPRFAPHHYLSLEQADTPDIALL
jgi:mannose-6-phosphate isomerase-like protein (cupin superfamily)